MEDPLYCAIEDVKGLAYKVAPAPTIAMNKRHEYYFFGSRSRVLNGSAFFDYGDIWGMLQAFNGISPLRTPIIGF